MGKQHKTFRTVLLNLSEAHKKRSLITIALSLMFMLITLAFTISSVESMTTDSQIADSRLAQLTSKVDMQTYRDILKSEIKVLPGSENSEQLGGTGYEYFVLLSKLLTGIEAKKMQTVLYQELPGFSIMAAELIGERNQMDIYAPPAETSPPDHMFAGEDGQKNEQPPVEDGPKQNEEQNQQNQPDQNNKRPVLIYHTHNREAFLPDLEKVTDPNEAYHGTKNITLIGTHLAEELEKRGVPTVVSTRDYWLELAHGEYWRSYEYSRKELDELIKQHDEFQFIFDIHRDSSARKQTTYEYEGQNYAAIWFIIGQLNEDWQYNYQFASAIESKTEQRFPGISRGIWAKKSGKYNQDVSDRSVLIEVGGVDNTLEEGKRTAVMLADVIAEMYWEEVGK